VFDLITDGRLAWAKMDPVYDRILIGDDAYDYVAGACAFRDRMLSYFPGAAAEIDRYLALIRAASTAVAAHFGKRWLPSLLQPLAGLATRSMVAPYFARTTREVLAEFIRDPRLASVLCGQWGDYGVPPAQSAFGMHAVVAQHYLDGASFPVGGASQIAHHVVAAIERAGGSVRTQAAVDTILLRQGRAIGVRMENGDEILAGQVISATGVFNTWTRLLPRDVGERHAIDAKLAALRPAIGHLGLYLGLRGDREALGLQQANLWVYRGYDHDAEMARFLRRPTTDFPLSYISFPSSKDPDWRRNYPGRSTIDVIAPAPYGWFKRWAKTPWNERGDDYVAYKQELAERLLETVYRQVPKARGKVDTWELSTPLSTEHFSAYAGGALYGLDHTVERFAQDWIAPKTPVKGLYLTGQDILFCGVASALMSGVMTAGQALGPAALRVLPSLIAPQRAVLGRRPQPSPAAPRGGRMLADPPAAPRSFTARCIGVAEVARDVLAFRFVDAAGAALDFQPGQYVTLTATIDGQRHQRSYSMSSAPTERDSFEIIVKRVPGGVVSNGLCDTLAVGDELPMRGAFGRFTCAPRPRAKLLFLSAGSGITPMLSMSRWIADRELDTDVVFYHCARTPEDLIRADELAELARTRSGFRVLLGLTRPPSGRRWKGHRVTSIAPCCAASLRTSSSARCSPAVRRASCSARGPCWRRRASPCAATTRRASAAARRSLPREARSGCPVPARRCPAAVCRPSWRPPNRRGSRSRTPAAAATAGSASGSSFPARWR
jgi:all-trans-retinol 13,14-reductase